MTNCVLSIFNTDCRLFISFFFSLVPVCLLEVNTTTTILVASFRYDRINDSVLKFVVGDKIIMHCNYGYKALHQNLTMVCKDENNGSWSHDPIECDGIYLNTRHVTLHITLQITALISASVSGCDILSKFFRTILIIFLSLKAD